MATGSDADRERAQAVARAARREAARRGVDLPPGLRLWALAAADPTEAAAARGEPGVTARRGAVAGAGGSTGAVTGEQELAQVLEAATPAPDRRANGLHVTPGWLADHLVGLAFDGLADGPAERPADGLGGGDPSGMTVCDPACGGGAFLLAAARTLHARGVDRGRIVRELLWGADIDPVGLATAEAALTLWAGEPPCPEHLVVGDALTAGSALWSGPPGEGFAAVVGNPPFLNQLGRATARSHAEVRELRAHFGPAVQPYTDTAWLFLLLGVELTRPGGQVALVQPLSLVGARDAAAVRAELDTRAELRDLWVEKARSFAAAVQVCAPVLAVRADDRRDGRSSSARPADGWSGRLADALGVPAIRSHHAGGRLAERASVTAGFRDEYYGLVPLVREADVDAGPDRHDERPLVTVGVLDWGRSRWGERPAQFARRRWTAPVVDVGRADPHDDSPAARGAARWLRRVSGPKVVVATQTQVVEAAVDEAGTWVPSVPALVVLPHGSDDADDPEDPDDLWRLAAAIAAPSSTVWLLRRAPGTARSRTALKIAARDLADLPLPTDAGAWTEAAAAFRAYATATAHAPSNGAEAFEAYLAAATAAYDADDALVAWWRARLRPA